MGRFERSQKNTNLLAVQTLAFPKALRRILTAKLRANLHEPSCKIIHRTTKLARAKPAQANLHETICTRKLARACGHKSKWLVSSGGAVGPSPLCENDTICADWRGRCAKTEDLLRFPWRARDSLWGLATAYLYGFSDLNAKSRNACLKVCVVVCAPALGSEQCVEDSFAKLKLVLWHACLPHEFGQIEFEHLGQTFATQ